MSLYCSGDASIRLRQTPAYTVSTVRQTRLCEYVLFSYLLDSDRLLQFCLAWVYNERHLTSTSLNGSADASQRLRRPALSPIHNSEPNRDNDNALLAS